MGFGGDITGSAGLGALADNGGFTLTHALLAGSNAINSGSAVGGAPPLTDQRGFARVGATDIGAYEYLAVDAPPVLDANNPLNVLEESSQVITSAELSASDIPNSASSVIFTLTGLPGGGGSLLLNSTVLGLNDTFTQDDIDNNRVEFSFVGDASDTSFKFTVSDGVNTLAEDTFVINGIAVNDAPSGADNTVTTLEDTAHIFTDADFGFSDAIDSPANNLLAVKITTLPGAGTLTLTGSGAVSAGDFISKADIDANKLVFTPALNANGAGYTSFTFQVQDDGGTDNGGVDLAVANTLTINVTPVNDAPVANSDVPVNMATNSSVNIDVIGNDTDVDGTIDPTTVVITVNPANGLISVNPTTGAVTFTSTGVAGPDSFTYTVRDNNGATSNPISVAVNVNAINAAPVAKDDSITATEDTVFNSVFDLDANDTDPDNDALGVVAGTFATSQGGTIVIAADGSYSYTPAANFNGSDSVSYTVTDGSLTDIGTLNITVNAVNDAPVATNDGPIAATEDTPLSNIDVLSNDTDVEGDTLSISGVPTAANGSVTVNVDGTLNYTPNANFNGVDTITYTISDGNGGNDTATVSVNVAAVNDAPVGTNDGPVAATEDTQLSNINVLANDSDVDGDTLSILGTPTALNGTVVVNGNNTLNYTPNANFNGVDTISYTISDGNGGTDTAIVSVNVAAVNDAPVAADDGPVAATEDTPLNSINVLANDSDVDGDTLSISGTPTALNGIVTVNGDNTLNYTPNANFNGADTISYRVSDGNGGTDTATVTVNVAAVNDDPTLDNAIPGQNATENSVFSFQFAANTFGDADGDTLTYSATLSSGAALPAWLIFDGNTRSFSGTPGSADIGTYSISVTADDANGGTLPAVTFTITVSPFVSPVMPIEDPTLLDPDDPVIVIPDVPVLPGPVDDPVDEVEESTNPVDSVGSDESGQPFEDLLNTSEGDLTDSGLLLEALDSDSQEIDYNNNNTTVQIEDRVLQSLRSQFDLTFETLALQAEQAFLTDFNNLRNDLQQDEANSMAFMGGSFILTAGLSAGYIVWLVRGGLLLSSVLSALPAWQMVDPLPVLSGFSDEDEDDESLESLITGETDGPAALEESPDTGADADGASKNGQPHAND